MCIRAVEVDFMVDISEGLGSGYRGPPSLETRPIKIRILIGVVSRLQRTWPARVCIRAVQ